jgi:dienelactone hydrolase
MEPSRPATDNRDDDDRPSRRRVLCSLGAAAGAAGLAGAGYGPPVRNAAADESENRCQDPQESLSPPNPGPELLDGELSTAPQLENGDGWDADPIMVSGTDAYVDGEYLYQDFVYDDHGANTTDEPLPPNPQPSDETTYGENGLMTGDVVYPTDEDTYRHNAADLLEFRAQPVSEGIRYRITLQTMVEPDAAAAFVAIDTEPDASRESDDLGYGIGDLGIAVDHELVAWGTDAELDGEPVACSVDVERNQIEVTVPLKPGEETWRHYVGVGLFDAEERQFREIQEQPDEERPGGSHGENPPPIFNVGFRFDEPMGAPNLDEETLETQLEEGTETGSRGIGYGHWRDHEQALALADRDISELHADVDFSALEAGTTRYNVPSSGFLNRLYVSGTDLGQGIGADEDVLLNRIQPYAVYVPEAADGGAESMPLHVHLHSLGSTHNEYATLSPNLLRQLGEERDALILTPGARGPAGWYQDEAELDVFEAWRDLAARYEIDEDRVTIGGFSMGGHGTYRLSSLYPDLFARSFVIAGPPDEDYFGGPTGGAVDSPQNTLRVTDNLRNLPLRTWTGSNDALVPVAGPTNYHEQLREHGYRNELSVFPGYNHFAFALRDQWGPAGEYLEEGTVERSPLQVTYRAVPAMDSEEFDLVHDGAYWVSDVEVAPDADEGLVDVRSLGFGEGEPVPADYEREGTEPDPHVKRGTYWRDPITSPAAANELEVDLEGTSAVTIWVDEAELDATAPIGLSVTTSDEATITLKSAYGTATVSVPAGESEREVVICGEPGETD